MKKSVQIQVSVCDCCERQIAGDRDELQHHRVDSHLLLVTMKLATLEVYMPARTDVPNKVCEQCGKQFNRTRSQNGRLEGLGDYAVRRFCSSSCYVLWNHGPNHWLWGGGTKRRPDGYLRYSDDQYVHRQVMESHLGRKLSTNEIVHHKDGDPSNNSINNLEVTTNSKHRKYHCPSQLRDREGRFSRE